MTTQHPESSMADLDALLVALDSRLFPSDEGIHVYAVLDGAAIPDLLDHLYGDEPPECVCLYSGDLEPDIAECAPYLVELKPGAAFTKWMLSEGWGNHWGVVIHTTAGLKELRSHLREFLMVRDPDGHQLYFRFYDPRVLGDFLGTCDGDQLAALFGPVSAFLCEGARPLVLSSYSLKESKLVSAGIPLLEAKKS